MAWKVTGSESLPIVEDDSWDGPAARREMIAAGLDVARRGHLIYNDGQENPEAQAHFRLPFARLVDGTLSASTAGLRAAASYLPQTDAPQDVLDGAREILDSYYAKMEEQTVSVRDFHARAHLFNTEGNEHEGMMIALYPPQEVAMQLANIPGVETPAEQMHITLLYLGNVQQLTDLEVAHVVWATNQWARSFHPIELKVNGIGRFNNSKNSDGKDVIYAVVDSHELDLLRNWLADELAPTGILRTDHGFNPHITLAYIEAGAESPIANVPTIDMTIDHLSLTMGDRVAHYPLGTIPQEDRTMSRHHKNLLGNMKRLYEELRNLFSDPVVNRDISLNGIAMQCVSWFEGRNMEAGDNWDDYHFLQEVYATEEGGIYVISVSGGKLYKWGVTVDHTTGDVTLSEPTQVTQVFTSSSESRTVNIRKREDGRYEAFAVLSTAMLNKDGQIDSRTLFDAFVERFRGDGSEYINLYHIGHDKTRIGELRAIFREGNVLVGYYVLDDNLVAKRVGETLSGEGGAEWGGSIEFWTEEEPEVLQVAEGVMAPVFRAGTLLGYSIALVADGAAWGTKHLMVNRMNKTTRQKVLKLLGNDEEAMAIVESWVDEANERTLKPGVITHATATDSDEEAEVEETADEEVIEATSDDVAEATVEHEAEDDLVEQALDDGTGNEPAQVDMEVNEEMLLWLLEQVAASEWGLSVDARISDVMTRLADAEAILATLTGSEEQTTEGEEDRAEEDEEEDIEMQVMNDRVDHVSESVALIGDRLTAIEETLQRVTNRQEAEAPATTRISLRRPKAIADRPTEKERTTVPANGKAKDAGEKPAKPTWKPTGLFK